MSSPPSDSHQDVLGEIYLLIATFVKTHHLGKTRLAPYGIYPDEENVRSIFIANQSLDKIKKNGHHGAPEIRYCCKLYPDFPRF